MGEKNLWEEIGNRCLKQAIFLMDQEESPTIETVETVKSLVSIAIAVDDLNLRWAAQTRYGEAVLKDPVSLRKGAGS